MKKVFKPLAPIHRCYLAMYIFSFFWLDICLIVVGFDLTLFLIVLIKNAVGFITYFIVRCFYPYRYIIDGEHLIKKKNKKIIFKIKLSDIECVLVQKEKWYGYFAYVIDVILNEGWGMKNRGTTISFVYQNCDMIEGDKKEISQKSLKSSECAESFEVKDIFSYKQCKKICRHINDLTGKNYLVEV